MHHEVNGVLKVAVATMIVIGGLLAMPTSLGTASLATADTQVGLSSTQARVLRDEVLANRPSRSGRTQRTRSLGEFEVTCYVLEGPTASGRPAGPGVVAVDPRVLPLGTRVTIEGFGERVAADTGRLIKGRRLDVWMDDLGDCVQFGRQTRAVSLG